MILSHTIHYDPKVFPSPSLCLPERHLPLASPSYPRNAYRPFERGPRACLGTPLAMEEMKIMLVMVARSFDFEYFPVGVTEGMKPRVGHTDLDVKLGDAVFTVQRFTTGPRGPLRVRVKKI
jgi:cytochrome P450